MQKSTLWKFLLSIAVVSWCVLALFPIKDTPFDVYISKQASVDKQELGALIQKAQERVANGTASSVFVALKALGAENEHDYARHFPHVNLADVKNRQRRNDILLAELLKRSHSKLQLGLDLQGGAAFTLRIAQDATKDADAVKQNLAQAMSIISQRVNGLGVAEPIVRERGLDAIEIQLPGLSLRENPEAVHAIKKPARLEFRLVHRSAHPMRDPTPAGYEKLEEEHEDPRSGDLRLVPYYIKRIPEATGEIVREAIPSLDPQGGYHISLQFTPEGAKRFASMTRRIAEENERSNAIGQLAIVLDGKLYSTPTVKSEIAGGNASISGRFNQREVVELANVLNNPLQFELRVDQMSEVGPSLAEDARKSSVNACLLGAGTVIVFMILYYHLCGLISVVSVLANLLIVVGILANIGYTMTLPGIAALVVTVGMGVDANILIFERMREELRAGKSMLTALSLGHERAFSTILDSNLTTLLTAFILIFMGTGPIKGFGVTLAIGICASMFCALVLSRALLEMAVRAGALRKLPPFRFFENSHFDFMRYRKPAFIGSVVIMIAGAVAIGLRGNSIYGIDFTGGDEITLGFDQKLPTQDLDALAAQKGLGKINPVYQKLIGEDRELLKLQTEFGQAPVVISALQGAFPEAGFIEKSTEAVGPSVGGHVKMNALLSLGLAMLGILFYVALRFEWGYGIGALVSTLHDIFMTIGIFVLTGGQFSAAMVASILMIIGYSINDTIVVFDRIREELERNADLSLRAVINLSINRTLSRTILTSLTTLLSALALYIFGAGVINDFAFVFVLGILTGTFSSIFIASPIFFWWHKGDRRHVMAHKDKKPVYAWDAGSKGH